MKGMRHDHQDRKRTCLAARPPGGAQVKTAHKWPRTNYRITLEQYEESRGVDKMYEGRTIEEAGRKWQNDAKWRVEQIARYLGIDMDINNRRWHEDGGTIGLFYKHKLP